MESPVQTPLARKLPARAAIDGNGNGKGNGKPAASAALELEQRMSEELTATLNPMGWAGRFWVAGLLAVIAAGLYAYILQLIYGLRVTAMREYVSWGLYMTNFVFFIGVSHAGTLISAILRVTHAEWRRPITRMAEAITLFALMIGAPMVIIDMGRPDRLHHVILYGRFNSPILWDVCSITTYIAGSLMYLYVAMIPDLALLANRAGVSSFAPWRVRLYRLLSIGYRGTPEQRWHSARECLQWCCWAVRYPPRTSPLRAAATTSRARSMTNSRPSLIA
jgi:molybdopterin-containing oxidoreductase family membrane subunit